MTQRAIAKTVEGAPCFRCGGTLRYESSRGCVVCGREQKRARNRTPEQKAAAKANLQEWKKNNRDRHLLHRRTSRYKIYGLNEQQFDALLASQNSLCPGCGDKLFADKATNIDHDHTTGKVRGLLCMRCNIALGVVRDSVETLLRLGIYLENSRG